MKAANGQHSVKYLYLPNGVLDSLWLRRLRCGIRANGFWAAAGASPNGRPPHILLQLVFDEAVFRLVDLIENVTHTKETAKANTHTALECQSKHYKA